MLEIVYLFNHCPVGFPGLIIVIALTFLPFAIAEL